ncbi:MAG: RNA polymerase sigma factor [Planctomycetota bacterium]|nr:RNA polymerase sigma factor [Planctomycetota bacterium]
MEPLIRRAQAGERAAWEDLCPCLEPLVRGWAMALLPPSEADDAVQEILLTIWGLLPQFKWQSKFTTWAYTVTRRKCRRIRQQEMRRRNVLAGFAKAGGSGSRPTQGAEGTEKVELRDEVRFALSQLSAADRRLLTLKYFLDNEYRQIAEVINAPKSALRERCRRARQRLRKCLEEQQNGNGVANRPPAPPDA